MSDSVAYASIVFGFVLSVVAIAILGWHIAIAKNPPLRSPDPNDWCDCCSGGGR